MSLAKRAQKYWEDEEDKFPADDEMSQVEELFSKIRVGEDPEDLEEDEPIGDIEIDEPEHDVAGEVTLQVGEENPEEFTFSLPQLPGSDDVDEPEEEEIEVEEEEDEVEDPESQDAWDYGGKLVNFLPWLVKMLQNIPRHNRETSGLERAIAYLSMIDKSISKAVRSDIREELDIAKIEEARKEIEDGIERLEKELEKRHSKKKQKNAFVNSEYAGQLVKEAQKIAGVQGRIVVTVPLIISRVARTCINGMVSAGHDIEDLFDRQVKKYNFDIQQQAELMQLLEDMGYPLRRDRGFLRDEEIDRTRSDNFDWAANYPA